MSDEIPHEDAIFDPEQLLRESGGTFQHVRERIDEFSHQAKAHIRAIFTAMLNSDYPAICREADKLAAAANEIDASRIADAALELKRAAQTEIFTTVENRMAGLRRTNDEFHRYCKKINLL